MKRTAAGELPTYRFWGSKKPQKKLNTARGVVAGAVATIRVYDPIDSWGGWWGISSQEFAEIIDELPITVTEIRVLINSPGGEAFEAIAMANQLRNHPAKTVGVVEGLAASAASVLACACDETVMNANSQLMIHDASVIIYGQAADLRKEADVLDKLSENIAGVYASKSGSTRELMRAAMLEESWYTDEEAVAAGLADRVGDIATVSGEDITADELDDPFGYEDRFDMSIFQHAGRTKAPAPAALSAAPQPPAAPQHPGPTTHEGSPAVALSDEGVTSITQKLGIPEDADETTILDALQEALEERTEPPATATLKDGQKIVSQTAWDDLQTKAQAGADAAQKLHAQERTTFLDSVRDKFPPAARATWEKQYDVDPAGTRDYLTTAAVIVPTTEVGHGGDGENAPVATKDDPNYKNWKW